MTNNSGLVHLLCSSILEPTERAPSAVGIAPPPLIRNAALVAFGDVDFSGKDLQVGFDVQSAHVQAVQRDDVVDMMGNAGFL